MHFWNILGDEKYPYQTEYLFHSERGWRFDFAWPDKMVAAEIEGGVFSGGRHVRGEGFSEDIEKYNQAVILGWKLLRFTPQQLEADPATCIGQVLQLLRPPTRTIHNNDTLCHCNNPAFEDYDIKCRSCGRFLF